MFLHRTLRYSALLLAPIVLMTGCCTTPNCTVTPTPAPASHAGRNAAITLSLVGAGGVIIYFAVHGKHFIKGCVDEGKTGLEIRNQGYDTRFTLVGKTSTIKAGETVRVKGRKGSSGVRDASGNRTFLVEKVEKVYGSCTVAPPGA
jgi:hypothetical protein